MLGHTRWASVGIISEPNPTRSTARSWSGRTASSPSTSSAAQRRRRQPRRPARRARLRFPGAITTDARSSRPSSPGTSRQRPRPERAFAERWSSFEGSVAIGVAAADDVAAAVRAARQRSGRVRRAGGRLLTRGREPYASSRDRSLCAPRRRARRSGRVLASPGRHAGGSGPLRLRRFAAAGHRGRHCASRGDDARHRSWRRGHFLLRRSPSRRPLRQTLRGRITRQLTQRERSGEGPSSAPRSSGRPDRPARRRLDHPRPRHRSGHGGSGGTVDGRRAGQLAPARRRRCPDGDELSGFGRRLDMSDTLAVASAGPHGTDDRHQPHRRPAALPWCGRRGPSSPALQRPDRQGRRRAVHFGRADVEMSVASTKAFYAQVAAGVCWRGHQRSGWAGRRPAPPRPPDLAQTVPDAMARCSAAARPSPGRPALRPHQAILGRRRQRLEQGARRGADQLSELCYKSIACDVIEDKSTSICHRSR